MTPGQLALPLGHERRFTRELFIAGAANAAALAFVDSWPGWSVNAAAIWGPHGSGKSHLAAIWQSRSQAVLVEAKDLSLLPAGPLIIEDADAFASDPRCALGLFHALERANQSAPVLLTGRTPPREWHCALPDLASRLAALAAIAIGAPDDAMLAELARALFAERQLIVPEAVVQRMLASIERSVPALTAFIEAADAASLAENRPLSLGIVRDLLARREKGLS